MENETTHDEKRSGLRRRQVLNATAWSVPVIAVAVAAPAAAAASLSVVTITLDSPVKSLDTDEKINSISGHVVMTHQSGASVTDATLTISIDNSLGLKKHPGHVSISDSEGGTWSLTGSSGDSPTVDTFNFSGTLAASKTSSFTFTITGHPDHSHSLDEMFPKKGTGELTSPNSEFNSVSNTIIWSLP